MIKAIGDRDPTDDRPGSAPIEVGLGLCERGAIVFQTSFDVRAFGPEAAQSWSAACLMAFITLALAQVRALGIENAWIYGSTADWCEEVGCSSFAELERAMAGLEDLGLVVTEENVIGRARIVYAGLRATSCRRPGLAPSRQCAQPRIGSAPDRR